MRILCIDYGDARIGVAVSDPMGWTAQMLETIQWRGDVQKPLDRICELAGQYQCPLIVVGLPKNMDGSSGFREERTREFMERLRERLPEVEIKPWDERLTTVMAQRAMRDMGINTKKQKGRIDQMAAAFILQSYLDSIQK
ncbi:Holliday junction resolvase RuvX [Thermoclostridium caenicola]|uniref:Putative pre-16S rRNA nuclease n=1 Tax=Thermoclostridium caenicola TaxID=659425 RepID=A0A1M6EHJ7_9FIRM|nr:Holliday junction resolvase RuvX [Thermoclostridium caenicola]SHI84800.1 putative holliday junction resolvase [Thermoclostridium caenicola]